MLLTWTHPAPDPCSSSFWALALLLHAQGQPGFLSGLKITSLGTLGGKEVISVPALLEHPPALAWPGRGGSCCRFHTTARVCSGHPQLLSLPWPQLKCHCRAVTWDVTQAGGPCAMSGVVIPSCPPGKGMKQRPGNPSPLSLLHLRSQDSLFSPPRCWELQEMSAFPPTLRLLTQPSRSGLQMDRNQFSSLENWSFGVR